MSDESVSPQQRALRRLLPWLPLPGLGELVSWWPSLLPAISAALSAIAFYTALIVQALPDWLAAGFALLGASAVTFFVISIIARYRTHISRLLLRSGVSLRPEGDGLQVSVSKLMVGTRRDLGVWETRVTVRGASAIGFNHSAQPIEVVSVYLRSLKTNERFKGYLDGLEPAETFGIPGRCEFRVHGYFVSPAEALSVNDFRDFVGPFELVLEYGERSKRVRFPLWWSNGVIQKRKNDPLMKPDKNRPRIVKRPDSSGVTP